MDITVLDQDSGTHDSPDIYFTSGYGRADQFAQRGVWRRLDVLDGRWQLPLVLYETLGSRDACSPYGYSGVYADPTLTGQEVEMCWRTSMSYLRDEGVTTLFLRRSPLVPQMKAPEDAVWVVRHHPTRLVPLGAPSVMWDAMEGRSRTAIRKAQRLGIQVTLEHHPLASIAAGSAFRSLYSSTMVRREAQDSYHFGDEYFQLLSLGLGKDLLLATANDLHGQALASALFMIHGDGVHYHLSGGTRQGGSDGATNLLIWEAACWAAESDSKWLHLGGGLEMDDGLYRFKKSFGGNDLSFSAIGCIVDRPKFDHKVKQAAGLLAITPEEVLGLSSFPPYRGVIQ